MTTLQEVKRLLKTIKDANQRIEKLQRACLHKRVWVDERPDAYCGWGVSKRCADCDKPMGCTSLTSLSLSEDRKPGRRLVKS